MGLVVGGARVARGHQGSEVVVGLRVGGAFVGRFGRRRRPPWVTWLVVGFEMLFMENTCLFSFAFLK